MKPTILIANAILACSILSVAYAADQTDIATQPQHTAKMLLIRPAKDRNAFERHKNFAHSWHRALQQTKQLSLEQAKTVATAAVILYGDSNMQVGEITPVAAQHDLQNYQVQITNKEGKTLETVLMNGRNGRIIQNPEVRSQKRR